MIIKTNNQNYFDIAAAIREVNGTTETYKPSEMALAIANIENGGIPCTFTITTAENATIIATLGSTSISAIANTNGIATLLLEKEGTWTISATYEGETKSIEVLVEHNIEEELAFTKTFYIIHNNVQYDYEFFEGWTWADFVASEYNNGNFAISGTNVTFFGYKVKANGSVVTQSAVIEKIPMQT